MADTFLRYLIISFNVIVLWKCSPEKVVYLLLPLKKEKEEFAEHSCVETISYQPFV